MGQKQSAFSESSSFSKIASQNSTTTTSSFKKLELKLTPIEIMSLKQIYHQLKSVDCNETELVTEEAFQEYLGLPANMQFGKILYRSFIRLPYIANYDTIPEDPTLTYSLLLYSIQFYCGEDQTLEDSTSNDSGSNPVLKTKLLFQSFCNLPIGEYEGETFQDERKVSCQDLLELFKGILWIFKAHYLTLLTPGAELTELVIDEKILFSLVQQMASIEREAHGIPRESFSADLLEEEISWPTFQTVVQRHIPKVFRVLERFLYTRFCVTELSDSGSKSKPISPKWLLAGVESMLPKLDLRSNILKIEEWGFLTWLLPDSKGYSWDVLYSGSEHGFSIRHLETKVFKYPAPTCLLIKGYPIVSRRLSRNRFIKVTHDPRFPSHELILGAYIAEPWKLSRSFWGTPECKLFELSPVYEVFPTTGSSNTYAYCHRSNGIGFGGRVNEFRLHIRPDFQTGTYSNDPLHGTWSYKLSLTRTDFDITFQIEDIEVVGLGGEVAKERQVEEWQFEEREIVRRGRTTSHTSEQTRQLLEQAGILEYSKKLDAFRTRKSLKMKRKPSRYAPYK